MPEPYPKDTCSYRVNIPADIFCSYVIMYEAIVSCPADPTYKSVRLFCEKHSSQAVGNEIYCRHCIDLHGAHGGQNKKKLIVDNMRRIETANA